MCRAINTILKVTEIIKDSFYFMKPVLCEIFTQFISPKRLHGSSPTRVDLNVDRSIKAC